MIRRIKDWLYNHFLPRVLKDTLQRDLKAAERENEKLRAQIRELRSYIDGMNTAIRAGRRSIVINNEVDK